MFLKAFILFGISGVVLSCDWGHWSSCSRGCGGGTQSRKGDCGSWWGKHSDSQSRSCNEHCYNGGYYSGGSCHCPARRTGRCCETLKRCYQDNGGCVETCTPNSHGSTCGCRHPGYKLTSDGRSCTDLDECKTHLCDQNCRNTAGSYACSCHHGYTLSPNKRSCIDNDECQVDHVKCEQLCGNTPGSYTCACREGYTLNADGYSCEDIDECQSDSSGCSHVCKNERGSYSCECPAGFQLDTDMNTCKDTDECSISPPKCQQACQNHPGSYKCGCRVGYRISSDGKMCEDIDDCIGVMCHHGGTCIDGVNSFKCTCPAGFKGKLCQNDQNECLGVFNGGCEDKCINTFGSFKCDCSGNRTLSSDGLFCTGGASVSVFEKQSIFRELLPRGCSTIQLARCTEGLDLKLSLSSTSPWFELKSDINIQYTLGIVFVELDAFALPVSMTGVEVVGRSSDFSLTIGSVKYTPSQGSATGFTKNDTKPCWTFDITPRYIRDFLQSLSFLRSFLSNIEKNLPKWISFTLEGTELLGLHDLKTEFLHGSDITNDAWCKGAPVIHDRLYSVFKFGGNFSLSIYGDSAQLPKALAGQRYCFIIDICQDYGGSIFLMIPKGSRDVLENVQMFKNLRDNYHLRIQPRGIGISLQKHVNVNLHSRELELWNGDQKFTYNVFPEANMWIGGDVVLNYDPFHVHAETDIYFTMPSLTSLLTSLFTEEWDLLLQTDIGADLQISLKVLGKPLNLNFGIASVDIYASLGGNATRKWCGDGSNPPGFFFSAMAEVNPFLSIPILQDFVFDFTARLYVFFTSNPSVDVSSNDNIDILTDILELEGFLKKFLNTSMRVADRYGVILLNGTLSVLEDLELSINRSLDLVYQLVDSLQHNVLGSFTYDWAGVIRSFENIWTALKSLISDDVDRFFDSLEFQTRVSKYNITSLFETEINTIKNNLMTTAYKISKQLLRILKDYKGVGFRFSAEMKIFVWRFGLIDFEAVHSIDHLGSCGKFKKAFKLFEGERSFRFFGEVNIPHKLAPFLKMQVGGGVGMALSIDSFKFLTQLHIDVNLLGILGSVDLFVNNNGLFFYAEGNLWSFFKARLEVSAEHGQDWSLLVLRVHGELLADSDGDKDFHDSYLDALRRALKSLGDAANERLGQAQHALTKAQSGLTLAQNWLESKKEDVRALNSKFDDAIRALKRVKDKLEEAKGPFRAAIAKLNAAQRHVDNLCRIEHCSRVCIPGLKCKICHTRGWIRVPYPCCHLTSCMISFPNPICVAKNLACRAIRAVAFLALEAVKLFVRIPILALDVAKVAVSVTQVVVDKARVVLDIAIAAIDLAKFGLEGAKGVLEVANKGIEAVKQVMKLGFKVLDMIVGFGLKSLVDLKNCMFDVRLTTKDLPVFAVSCEVNVLRLGWTKIKFGVNFNRPFQSLWQAAKATITSIMDTIGHRLFGRKRRDLLHESLLKTHAAFRIAREINSEFNLTENELNETINIVFQTAGFHNDSEGDDYENRVGVFKVKCDRYQKMFSYLNEANRVLYEIANETNTMLVSASRMRDDLDDFDIENIRRNFTIENTGINPEVAMRDYNLTLDDLHDALADANSTLKGDPLLQESSSASILSKQMIENSTSSLTNIQITDQWLLAMDNVTLDYFSTDVCVSFLDCAHYSIAELLDVYYAEEFENISEIVSTLSVIEDTFLVLVGNSSLSIQSVYNLSRTIGSLLKHLDELNPLCSSAPVFLSPLVNQTVVLNTDATILCNVSGNPEPSILWYENGEVLPGEHSKSLVLTNVTRSEVKQYMCIAGNVVANLSSDSMYLDVKEFEDVIVDQDLVKVTPIDMRNDTSDYETGTEVSNKDNSDGLSEKVTAHTQEKSDLKTILIASITSGCVLCLVTGLVVWKLYARHKFRKAYKMANFMSMTMIRPSAASVGVKSADVNRTVSDTRGAGVDCTVTNVEPGSIVQ